MGIEASESSHSWTTHVCFKVLYSLAAPEASKQSLDLHNLFDLLV